MTRKTLLVAIAVLAVVAAAAWSVRPRTGSNAPGNYKTLKVERGDLTKVVSANGTLNPVVLVNVGTQVSGIVKKLHVDFNDPVKAGQVLLELDPALVNAQLQQSKANVESAIASLELARANAARTEELYAKEYVSRQEYDQSLQALRATEAATVAAQAQVARDRTNVDYAIIRSPVNGVVVSRQVDEGQTVAASFQTPTLFSIAQDLSKMRILANVAEADIGSIKPEQKVSFTVDAFPDRTFQAKVAQVRLNPTTQQNVVTYTVVIDAENSDRLLIPGMTAYVAIVTAQRHNVVKVPNAALRFRPPTDVGAARQGSESVGRVHALVGDEPMPVSEGVRGTVYQQTTAGLEPTLIRLGISDDNFTEALSGTLNPGDALVIEDRLARAANAGRGAGLIPPPPQ
jgi:HlyD family secretion protein